MLAAIVNRLKSWARTLKTQLILLWLCCRQPATPWSAKVVALTTVAYALSPVDLIPDFIPVLGFVDDVMLLPLGIALALRMIPAHVLQHCRPQAQALAAERIIFKGRWLMAGGIVIVWLLLATYIWTLIG